MIDALAVRLGGAEGSASFDVRLGGGTGVSEPFETRLAGATGNVAGLCASSLTLLLPASLGALLVEPLADQGFSRLVVLAWLGFADVALAPSLRAPWLGPLPTACSPRPFDDFADPAAADEGFFVAALPLLDVVFCLGGFCFALDDFPAIVPLDTSLLDTFLRNTVFLCHRFHSGDVLPRGRYEIPGEAVNFIRSKDNAKACSATSAFGISHLLKKLTLR
jgi:hypothetical protein